MSATPRLLGGRYEVGELIGRGGMAEVHAGHDTRLGRAVAIKMLRSDLARDHTFLARFRREAQSAAGLNHAAIVAVYDSGEDHTVDYAGASMSVPYIVMERVTGKTLRQLLNDQEHQAMDPVVACHLTEGVLAALEYSHRMGIVHRDIKPANVMVTEHGDVKVMDFGIARAVADTAATMTQTQAVIGTAQYLSPEQAQGQQVDARSDLYSTGCLIYELLTGRAPFIGDSPVAIAYQHVGETPQPPSAHNPEVSPELDAVVLHALTKDREARYQTASEFRADLAAARTGRPISAAALGTAAGMAAGAAALGGDSTMLMAGGEPTQAMTRPTAVAGAAAAGAAAADARRGNTAGLPPIGHDPDVEPRKRHAGVYALLIAAVIAALVLVAFAGKSLFGGGTPLAQTVKVPSVVTLPQATAVARLEAMGLKAQVSQANNDAAKGTVFDQNPTAGSPVDKGSTVAISVSSGPGKVEVPDVTGFTESSARSTIEDHGLKVGSVTKVDDSSVAAGKVISTDPAGGSSVDSGSTVNLKVASGRVQVPDVRNKTLGEAQQILSDLGLRTKTEFQPSDQPEGTVLDQNHVGETVDAGTTIKLVVSQAQPQTTQPSTQPSDTPTQPSATITLPSDTTTKGH